MEEVNIILHLIKELLMLKIIENMDMEQKENMNKASLKEIKEEKVE